MINNRVFYNISELGLKDRKKLINLFKKHSHQIKIDDLDCSISFARVKSNLSYEDAIKNFNTDCSVSLVLNESPDVFSGSELVNSELVLRMKNNLNTKSYSEVFIWFFVEKNIFLNKILPSIKINPY